MKYFVRRDIEGTPFIVYRTGSDGDFYLSATTDGWIRHTDARTMGALVSGEHGLDELDTVDVARTLVTIRARATHARPR